MHGAWRASGSDQALGDSVGDLWGGVGFEVKYIVRSVRCVVAFDDSRDS